MNVEADYFNDFTQKSNPIDFMCKCRSAHIAVEMRRL